MQVLEWYNQINSFMLDYISSSIKESELSNFYRLIIAFKNLQRSVEFSGKSGIFGIRWVLYMTIRAEKNVKTWVNSHSFNSRFLSSGDLKRKWHHSFIRYEMLRKEYLNQTFNFMPTLQELYDKRSRGQNYEEAQRQITQKEDYSQLGIHHLLKRFQLFKEKRLLNRKFIILKTFL